MWTRCRFLLALVSLSVGASASAQEIKSPAALMPANVWVYGEVRQPGRLVEEIQKLFAGSVLGDVPRSFDKLRSEPRLGRIGMSEGFIAGIFLAPEMARELSNLQGVGAAFAGFDANGEPEFLVTVLPGKSNIPPFLMRMFLTMAPVRASETAENVPIYRLSTRRFRQDEPAPDGPAFAMTPSALLIGSPNLVKDAILRLKGKIEGSLADAAAFQEAARAVETHPGLFAYANPGAILQGLKAFPRGAFGVSVIERLISPGTFRGIGYSLGLDKGTFLFKEVALLDKKEKSFLLELAPSQPLDRSLLDYAPRDAIFAAALSNVDGEKRFRNARKALADLDREQGFLVKLNEALEQLEQKAELDLTKDVIGKIAGLGVAMGDPLKVPVRRVEEKGPGFHRVSVSPEVPLVIIVQAVDEEAAKELEKIVPRVFGMFSGRPEEPTQKKLSGQTIHQLKFGRSDSASYGRNGSVLVLGPRANPVAHALAAGSKKQGLLSQPRLEARAKELDDAVALVLVRPVGAVMGLLMRSSGMEMRSVEPAAPKKAPEIKREIDKEANVEIQNENAIAQPVKKTEIVQPDPDEEKILKQFAEIVAREDWFVMRVARTEDRILVDGRAPGLDKIVPKFVDFAMEQYVRFAASEPPFSVVGNKIKPEIPRNAGKVVFTVSSRLTKDDPFDRVRAGSHHKVFKLKMEMGRTYVIEAISSKKDFFDNYLRLEDGAGNQITQDDDGAGDLNARIVFRCNRADFYRIIVTSFGGGQTGSFVLTVREVP